MFRCKMLRLLQILYDILFLISNRGSIPSRAAGSFSYKCLYFTRCKALQDWSRLKGGPSLEAFCSTFVSAGQLSPLAFRHAKSPDSLAKRVWKSMVLRAPPFKISWRRRVRRPMAPGCGAPWMILCMMQWNLWVFSSLSSINSFHLPCDLYYLLWATMPFNIYTWGVVSFSGWWHRWLQTMWEHCWWSKQEKRKHLLASSLREVGLVY